MKSKIFITVIFFLIAKTILAQTFWTEYWSVPNGHICSMTINNKDELLVGNSSGIYLSTDNGNTFGEHVLQNTGDILSLTWIPAWNNLLAGVRDAGSSGHWGGVYLSVNDGNYWQYMGLSGHCVNDIVEESGGAIIAACFPSDSPGSLFSSSDFGKTWSMLFGSDRSFVCLAIDKYNVIYAGAEIPPNGSDGILYRSTDHGNTWGIVSSFPNSNVQGIVCDSSGNIVVYAGGSLYLSTDNGNNWLVTLSGKHGVNTWKVPMIVDKNNHIFVGFSQESIYISTDGGFSWNEQSSGLSSNNGFRGLATKGNYVFAGNITGELFMAYTVLPVELSSFVSNVQGRNIVLNWFTQTEKNSDKFVIERANFRNNENLPWINIGSVKASVLSNSPKQYSFVDKNLQSGTYHFRLKMIDNDGTFEYSKVIETEVAVPKNFELSQNYPNPFNPSTKINYNLPFDSKVTLEVYNITGERIGQLVYADQSAGYYSVDFNPTYINRGISSGIYFYRISAINKVTVNMFSSIKKMILLK